MLTHGGDKLLDGITKYVVSEGFGKKLRELRAEFFSKTDFQTQSMKFTSTTELDKVKKDITSQI